MAENEEIMEVDADSYGNKVKQRLKDRTKVFSFIHNRYIDNVGWLDLIWLRKRKRSYIKDELI